MDWNYTQPVPIMFGNGRIRELKDLLKEAQRPLLVADPFFVKTGFAQKLAGRIGGAELFSELSPNPDVGEVNACAELIREKKIDVLVALGGGSSLDLAKAASLAQPDIREFHRGKPAPKEHLPVIAVPTTAGTGSEVTCVSVLSDQSSGRKAPIVSESFYPKAALIDPELTYSLPPAVTASTGIDVLCHAVEGYWSRNHQPVCDALAVHAVKTVFRYLPIAYRNPQDARAREKLAEASVIAGLAFTLPKTTSSHACSFPLTGIYHIPHGEACGLTLDYFIRVNREDPHTQELCAELGYESADAFADAVIALKRDLNLRLGLKDFQLSREQIRELVSASHHPNLENNPVTVTDGILTELYTWLAEVG